MTKLVGNKTLDLAMMEKYFHSQGAALCREGRFDEAIGMLHDAISMEDQPYTRYQLSQAYLGKGDLEKAIEEISHAIALNNCIPEYYYERRELWLSKDDIKKARIDNEKMLKLDKNYNRIREIHHAARVVRQAFLTSTIDRPLDTARVRQRVLREAIHDYNQLQQAFRGNIENSTCTLPCPAYCCHFSGETITHGLSIGPWKLLAIRNFLRDQKFVEKDYLCKMKLSGDQRVLQLIPPHHTARESGDSVIYFPARHKGSLNSTILRSVPKDIHYKSLIWINKRAKPCAFLQDRRCMIHDLGDEQGLPSCKEFLCMTGFVFVVLDYFGAVNKERVASMVLVDLNQIAIEALLIITNELIEHPNLTKHRKTMKTLLKKAIKEDKEGNKNLVSTLLKRYSVVKDQYEDLFAAQKDKTRKAVETLLMRLASPPPSG
jgi:tetratricopeptide (TPR) repeat protein